jgi:hypothetical protein
MPKKAKKKTKTFASKVKEAPAKKKQEELPFGPRDRIVVNYRTKWFDIIDVTGVILRANRNSGYPFKVRLENPDGKPINLGHNDDGGEPGSGPFVYCKLENLTLVEKYVPKRLEGSVKDVWKIGERFTTKKDFGMDQDEHDDRTGTTEDMIHGAEGKAMVIAAVINRCGVDWLLDGEDNYMWLADWIDPIEN